MRGAGAFLLNLSVRVGAAASRTRSTAGRVHGLVDVLLQSSRGVRT
jgi:hypothetical protein